MTFRDYARFITGFLAIFAYSFMCYDSLRLHRDGLVYVSILSLLFMIPYMAVFITSLIRRQKSK